MRPLLTSDGVKPGLSLKRDGLLSLRCAPRGPGDHAAPPGGLLGLLGGLAVSHLQREPLGCRQAQGAGLQGRGFWVMVPGAWLQGFGAWLQGAWLQGAWLQTGLWGVASGGVASGAWLSGQGCRVKGAEGLGSLPGRWTLVCWVPHCVGTKGDTESGPATSGCPEGRGLFELVAADRKG